MNLLKYKGLEVNPAHLHETVTVQTKKTNKLQLVESSGHEEYLLPRIEAIHAGATRNYNHYLAERLKGDPLKKSGVYSWMQPYAKPVIYNHDTETEVTGRILHAAYADYTQAGKPGIILIPKISEPRAVEALKAGRLLTVSVGATTDAAICSLCGTDIINEGYCGHMKGEEYDGRVAEWIAGDLWFDELSWVNVPADQDAMVVDTQSSIFLDNTQEVAESFDSVPQQTSATQNLSEYFGVPKGIPIIVPHRMKVAESKPAEKIGQEESQGMEKQTETPVLEPEVTDVPVADEPQAPAAEPAVEPEAAAVVVEDEPATAVADDEPAVEPTPEPAADANAEPEVPAVEPAAEPAAEPAKPAESALEIEVAGLRKQVEALSAELKGMLMESISEKAQVKPEMKESYMNRLRERTLDSLRDTLTDLNEGFKAVAVEEVKEEAPRTVKKVTSPVPAGEESKKTTTVTEEETLKAYKKLLGF